MFEVFFESLMTVFQPTHLIALYLCSVAGCILGAIPGLAGGTGITLLLPLTFAMTPELSFCMLLGLYIGGVSGSFISAVLVGIPGSAASIATCYEGYPMTQKGQAGRALTIGILASFIGTFFSVLIATFCSSLLSDIALLLGPWEYFSLCFMAVSLVIGLGNGSIFKGLMAAFIGLFLATVGTDPVSSQMRFTFGNYNLFGGINVISLLMGVFALQQVAVAYGRRDQEMPPVDAKGLKGFGGLTIKDFIINAKTIIISFFLGAWIGFLPGLGGGVANVVSWGRAKRASKNPEKFGTGCDEGMFACEVANNASIGGAMIPMIALGIPGDGTGVMLLAALTIHGLQAGPLFIDSNPRFAALIFAAMLVSAVLIVITELALKRWFPYLLKAPYHHLYGSILMICFVGAFSSTTSMFSVYQMIFFGLLGILLSIFKLPYSPMMLSYVLGKNLEKFFRMGCSYALGDMTSFLTRPFSLIFLVIGIYSLFSPAIKLLFKKIKAKKAA